MTNLKKGDIAPDFRGIIQDGTSVSKSDFDGQKLILFFYPKDNTPGCNAEVCSLRDEYATLKKMGYKLLGVSADSLRKHKNFINKFDLPFDLLSDTNHEVIKAYEVWGTKKFMGMVFDGIHRTTFIINKEGIIDFVIPKVRTKDHAHQILEIVGNE